MKRGDFVKQIINKFKLELDWKIDSVYQYSNDIILLQYIEPHNGTNNRYLIRIDYRKTFDRWSVAWYYRYFNDIEDIKEDLINDIELIVKYEDKSITEFVNYTGEIDYEFNYDYEMVGLSDRVED